MFSFEGRHNYAWLANPWFPLSSRVMMLLVFAALLALTAPVAQAAGCTAYDFWEKPSELRYIMVPDNNFIGDAEPTVYSDEKCEQAR